MRAEPPVPRDLAEAQRRVQAPCCLVSSGVIDDGRLAAERLKLAKRRHRGRSRETHPLVARVRAYWLELPDAVLLIESTEAEGGELGVRRHHDHV